MNDTQLKAAGGEKAFFLKPETYELIRTAARGTIIPDETQFSMERRGNQTFFSLINPGTATGGAFFTTRTVVSGGADNGDIYLQGGNVGGGTGNEEVVEILIYDASVPAWVGSAGDHLVLSIPGNGQVTSGILDPIFNVSGTPTATAAAAVGTNTLPSIGDVSGTCKLSLGTFTATGFSPALPGNINIAFCWGGFTPTRV